MLNPSGLLAIMEFKKIDGPPGLPIHVRLASQDVERIVTRYGFIKERVVEVGPYNYLMTFIFR